MATNPNGAPNLAAFLDQAFATVKAGAEAAGCNPPKIIAVECRLDALGRDIAEGHNVVRFEVDVPAEDEAEDGDEAQGDEAREDGDAGQVSPGDAVEVDANVDDPSGESSDTDDDELDRLTRPDDDSANNSGSLFSPPRG